MEMSWLDKLTQGQAEMAARDADPWRLRLERLRGKVGADGIERTTTQTVFDILEIPQRARGAGACRRLAKLMSELGWMGIRVRGLTRGGIASRFVATAAMPGTGAIPTVDWDVKVST
jgi:hypothetical protein